MRNIFTSLFRKRDVHGLSDLLFIPHVVNFLQEINVKNSHFFQEIPSFKRMFLTIQQIHIFSFWKLFETFLLYPFSCSLS